MVQNMAAARAFNRIMKPHREAYDMAYEFDSQFDGGEFSVPAIGRHEQDTEERLMAEVSRRFGITTSELSELIFELENGAHDPRSYED